MLTTRDADIFDASVAQVFEDNHGVPHIRNLFVDFDMTSLPDAINGPTQTRLNRFLRDDLKLAITAPELTVRGIVAEMMKFNTSGTLCWDVFERNSHGGVKTPSLMQTTSAQVELRRVASRCAAYVFTKVEEADAEHRQAGQADSRKTMSKSAKAKVCAGLEWVLMSLLIRVYGSRRLLDRLLCGRRHYPLV